jgi:hypothetical protein
MQDFRQNEEGCFYDSVNGFCIGLVFWLRRYA